MFEDDTGEAALNAGLAKLEATSERFLREMVAQLEAGGVDRASVGAAFISHGTRMLVEANGLSPARQLASAIVDGIAPRD